jgi:hypothetical protein
MRDFSTSPEKLDVHEVKIALAAKKTIIIN